MDISKPLGREYKDATGAAGDAAIVEAASNASSGAKPTAGSGTTAGKGSSIQPAEGVGAPKVDGAQALGAMAENSQTDSKKTQKVDASKASFIGTGYGKQSIASPTGYGGNNGLTGDVGRRAMRIGEVPGGNSGRETGARPVFGSLPGREVNDQLTLETLVAETSLAGLMAPRSIIPNEPAPSEQDVTGTDEATYYVLDKNDHSYDFVKGLTGVNSENFNTSVDEVIIPGAIIHDAHAPGKDEYLALPSSTLYTGALETGDKDMAPGWLDFEATNHGATPNEDGYIDIPTSFVRKGEFVLKSISFGAGQGGTNAANATTIVPDVNGRFKVKVSLLYQDVTADRTKSSTDDRLRFVTADSNIRLNRVEACVMENRKLYGNNLSPMYAPYFAAIPELIEQHTLQSIMLSDIGATIYAAHATVEPAIANMMYHIGKTGDAYAAFGYLLTGGAPYSQEALREIGIQANSLMANGKSGADRNKQFAALRYLAGHGSITGVNTTYDSPWKAKTFLSALDGAKYSIMSPIKQNLGKIGNYAISPDVLKRINHSIEYGLLDEGDADTQPVVGVHHVDITHTIPWGCYYANCKTEDLGNGYFTQSFTVIIDTDRRKVITAPLYNYKYQYTGMSAVQKRRLDNPVILSLLKQVFIDDIGDWKNRCACVAATHNLNEYYGLYTINVDNNCRALSYWQHVMCKNAIYINQYFKECFYDLYKFMYASDYTQPVVEDSVIVRKLPYTWLTSFLDGSVTVTGNCSCYSGITLNRNGTQIRINEVKASYTSRPRWVEDLVWFYDRWTLVGATVSKDNVSKAVYADPDAFLDSYCKDLGDTSYSRRYNFAYPSKTNLFYNRLVSLLNMRNITPRDLRKRRPPYILHPTLLKGGVVGISKQGNDGNTHVMGYPLSYSHNATPGFVVTTDGLVTRHDMLIAPREWRSISWNMSLADYPAYFCMLKREVKSDSYKGSWISGPTNNFKQLYFGNLNDGSTPDVASAFDGLLSIDADNATFDGVAQGFCPQPIQIEVIDHDKAVPATVPVLVAYAPTYVAFRFRRPQDKTESTDALSSQGSVVLSLANKFDSAGVAASDVSTATDWAANILMFEAWLSAPLTSYHDKIRALPEMANISSDCVVYHTLQALSDSGDMQTFGRAHNTAAEFDLRSLEPVIYKLYNDELVNEFDQAALSIPAVISGSALAGFEDGAVPAFARMMANTAGLQPILYQIAFKRELEEVRQNNLTMMYDPFYQYEEWKDSK